MKKATAVTMATILLFGISSIDCQAAVTPSDLTTPEQQASRKYSRRTQYDLLIPEMKDMMLDAFQQEGKVMKCCVLIGAEEYSELEFETFDSSDEFAGYVNSEFFSGIKESYAREYYTIMSCEEYNSLLEDYSGDEYKIFSHLVNTPEGNMTDEELAETLEKSKQPISLETFLFDNEYFIVKATMNEYVIQKGDTLSKIATRFETKVDELAEINHIENKDLIYADNFLIVR